MSKHKWAVAVAAGAFTTAFIGGVALAGFQLPIGEATTVATAPSVTDTATDQEKSKDKMKAILDALVAKGTITRAQEDAILQAFKDAAPSPRPNVKPTRPTGPNPMAFMGDLMRAASDYLGIDPKTLSSELRAGKSLADLANGLSAQGKSAQGLITTLTNAANARVDAAVTAKKLTADQAAALKPKVAAEITTVVNRSFTKPTAPFPKPLVPAKPSPSPKS
jgi:polyhydroxyalkanoate synthesis regulator phasin